MPKSNVSTVTNLIPTVNEGFNTTIGAGGAASGSATVPLTSTSGLVNGSIFVGLANPGGTNQQTFTGIVDTSGNQITAVKWTRGTNADHVAGETVVDYVTGTTINMIGKHLATEHKQDGTHGNVTADSLTLAGSLTVPAHTITAPMLDTSSILLGFASTTTPISTASLTAVSIPELTKTVTIPAGGRTVKITAYLPNPYDGSAATGAGVTLSIWDGTVGIGTQLNFARNETCGPANAQTLMCLAFVTPSAGTRTYNAGFSAYNGAGTSGTCSTNVNAGNVGYLSVELL